MTRRRLGTAAARSLAASPSLEAALATLVDTPYGHDVRQDQTLTDAQRAVVATLLWNVRVLAGWAPGPGVTMLRALVGVLEAANVEDHLRRLAGAEPPAPYRLGGLATAWPRLARTTSTEELRRVLSASPWGDPGGDTPREVGLAMRAALVDRVMATAPSAATWAIAATALVVAREVIRDGHELPARARDVASRVLGAVGSAAGTLPELVASLPPDLRWTLADVAQSGDLWRAEARWWAHVDHDGRRLARAPVAGSDVLVGVVAMMAADAWRVRAALELAARGGAPLEVFDAVA